MRVFFIKTVLGIFAIIILGILSLGYWVIEPAFDEFSQQDFQEESSLEHVQLSTTLAIQPPANWQLYVANYNSHFELTTHLIPSAEVPNQSIVFQTLSGKSGFFWEDDEDLFYVYFQTSNPAWSIRYTEGDSELLYQGRSDDAVILLLIGPLIIILLAMLMGIGYLLYNFSKPIRALEQAMESFQGDVQIRLKPEQVKAIPKMAIAFNTMAEQLSRTLTEQQVMIAAIPHELRTPIARIRFALDMLRGKQGEPLRQGLEDIDSYVDELHQVAEDVLQLSRLQHQKLMMQSIDLSLLLRLKAAPFTSNAGFQLVLAKTPITIQGHAGLLRQSIANLLNNAIQHYKNHIKVRLYTEGNYCFLEVENDGAQLSQQDVKQLFQAFFRADGSRSRHTGGVGIGLTLVAQIMEKHRAQVSAQLLDSEVLMVRLKFPLA
ncbi:MAG: HAMP domain-containing sensor histidine kinase [Oceanospirillaceae bacterium]